MVFLSHRDDVLKKGKLPEYFVFFVKIKKDRHFWISRSARNDKIQNSGRPCKKSQSAHICRIQSRYSRRTNVENIYEIMVLKSNTGNPTACCTATA